MKAKANTGGGMKLKDLVTRYVGQGPRETPRRRSELPVSRAATSRTLPSLTNVEIQRILDEEEIAGGRSN